MIRRTLPLFVLLAILALVLFVLLHHLPAQMEKLLPQQLQLFHWWNAYSEVDRFGPPVVDRLPIHEGGRVWGRSGFQWIQSVTSYLAFREGSSWRPDYHRFHPVRQHYVECIAIVRRAYFGNVRWWTGSARFFPKGNKAWPFPFAHQTEERPISSDRERAA
ncbi:MAG TPA: hypothetical protein VKW06_10555 [Candidatus Angelobacter sp.]|nr:hypothetical protein [Candidatus Angelobacter sp.]